MSQPSTASIAGSYGAREGSPARKRHAILRAGADAFLRLGYGSTSMEAIAAEAGVSKQTIYNHFGSKEVLFRAIVEGLVSQLLRPIEDHRGDADPKSALTSLAREFFVIMLKPSSLAMHRLLVADAGRFPELAAAVYDAGPARIIATLARFLARETRKGRLAVEKPRLAAEQFFGMLNGYLQVRALFGVEPLPSDAELETRAAYGTKCFLKMHARRKQDVRRSRHSV
jgi:TetR/AcrR family transcriptional repressor of mexJK operon